jgi:hypothetical protein
LYWFRRSLSSVTSKTKRLILLLEPEMRRLLLHLLLFSLFSFLSAQRKDSNTLINEQPDSGEEKGDYFECSICLETKLRAFAGSSFDMPCHGGDFCKPCLKAHLKSKFTEGLPATCPLCRQSSYIELLLAVVKLNVDRAQRAISSLLPSNPFWSPEQFTQRIALLMNGVMDCNKQKFISFLNQVPKLKAIALSKHPVVANMTSIAVHTIESNEVEFFRLLLKDPAVWIGSLKAAKELAKSDGKGRIQFYITSYMRRKAKKRKPIKTRVMRKREKHFAAETRQDENEFGNSS